VRNTLKVFLTSYIKHAAIDGNLPILLLDSRHFNTHNNFLISLLHFSRKQAPAWQYRQLTIFFSNRFIFITSEMGKRFSTTAKELTPTFRKILPSAPQFAADALTSFF